MDFELVDAGEEDGMHVEVTNFEEDEAPEPEVGMEFESEDAAKTFYDAYARRLGFSIRSVRSKTNGPITTREFVCTKESLKRKNTDSCHAVLKIEKKELESWVATKFLRDHNHSLVSPSKVHYLRSRRQFADTAKSVMETMEEMMPTSNVTPIAERRRSVKNTPITPMETNRLVRPVTPVAFVNVAKPQKRTLGRDAQNILEYFKKMQAENPGFFYAIQLDDDNRMTNVFWADARSRAAYTHFGDAVTFDTTFRLHNCKVPFAPFTGVNHHGQLVLFGCALLLDDSESSFVWLFKTWLSAMYDRAPVSLTTDQDRTVMTAVSQVFPKTRHCICKWHILREGEERLGHVAEAHPTLLVDLHNCINLTETIQEFESSWELLLDKYSLRQNEWLQALHNARHHWVPAYFRDTFFGKISVERSFEDVTSFFEGYVDPQTTLPLFFKQYERALEDWFGKEIEADFDTICTMPVLKTPSPMERQAANIYTRKIFAKFQDELVETFVYTANKIEGDGTTSTYRVAKFEDDNKSYTVTLTASDMRMSTEMGARCSCQMFEYAGILCRHILTVFTVSNVLTLPNQYILKRWTKNAKNAIGFEEYNSVELEGYEPLTVRYNNLCREAIKFAEEGAVATETYSVALAALKESSKKVALLKKNMARVAPPTYNHEDVNRKVSTSSSEVPPLLWPRRVEVSPRFNLNDLGATSTSSVADLNLPHMAPVSVNRDDGPPDDMASHLPCLKSMTWVMEDKDFIPANRVAVINLKLQDHSKGPAAESDVKFHLSRTTLEPMLRNMAFIAEQLASPTNRSAVINLKLQDTETATGESEVRFQVSRDTLGAMMRSMAYIREQLSGSVDTLPLSEPSSKKRHRR